jgi:peptidoglycan/xylan/chitin deacetylase (PgdA/CDA1 family)
MLNFRNVNILFIGLLIAGIACGISFWLYVVLGFLYSLILFYGCYYIGSNFFLPVICSANTTEKVIAISFDDGPHEYTPKILQILQDNDVKAAFFCIGNRISGNEVILQQIHTDEHIIGNHSFSHHFWFDMFGSKKMLAEMQLMDSEVKSVTGKTPTLFRPPYGVINPNLKKAIIKGNYTPIGWNVRSMDTVIKDESKLLNKIIAQIKPGAVFLFHDTSLATIAILPAFIKQVKANGYRIVRLDQMLNIQAYA